MSLFLGGPWGCGDKSGDPPGDTPTGIGSTSDTDTDSDADTDTDTDTDTDSDSDADTDSDPGTLDCWHGSPPEGVIDVCDLPQVRLYGWEENDLAGIFMAGSSDSSRPGPHLYVESVTKNSNGAYGYLYGKMPEGGLLKPEQADAWMDYSFTSPPRLIGDIDDDGYDDLSHSYSIFAGPLEGEIEASERYSIKVADGGGSNNVYGDLNGDGQIDVALSSADDSEYIDCEEGAYGHCPGAVTFLYGPITTDYEPARSDAPAVFFGASNYRALGTEIRAVGDTDGDGFEEILAIGYDFLGQFTYDLLPGDATGVEAIESEYRVFVDTEDWGLVGTLDYYDGIGDLNGDGYDDVGIGAPVAIGPRGGQGLAVIFYGPLVPNAELSAADVIMDYSGVGDGPGNAIQRVNDLDGNGFDEIVASGGEYLDTDPQGVYLMFGPLSGSYPMESAEIRIGSPGYEGECFGCTMVNAGDLDGDTLDDIAVGAYTADIFGEDSGVVFILSGAGLAELGSR